MSKEDAESMMKEVITNGCQSKKLFPALDGLIKSINDKSESLKGTIKTGRTHLMDAMPIDFYEELKAWSSQLKSSKEMLNIISILAVFVTLK